MNQLTFIPPEVIRKPEVLWPFQGEIINSFKFAYYQRWALETICRRNLFQHMYQALIWFGFVLQYHSTIIYNLVFMLLTTVKVVYSSCLPPLQKIIIPWKKSLCFFIISSTCLYGIWPWWLKILFAQYNLLKNFNYYHFEVTWTFSKSYVTLNS